MKASRLLHQGEERIQVNFPYNSDDAKKLKQIPGANGAKRIKPGISLILFLHSIH